ncbi:MAG: trypsin-like serine protease [Ignavibacteria bacterium]|nr:trypsin-like serine protease [Ignavibacteria bacterium]
MALRIIIRHIGLVLTALLPLLPMSGEPIITWHDVEDHRYIDLAQQYPEVESLFFFNATDMAGTLIRQEWVLSAAHVADYLNVGDSITAKNRRYEIREIVVHPQWEDDQVYDLALIRIRNDINELQPIPVYAEKDELHKSVLIIGNGDNGTGLSGPLGNDGLLRAATNRVEDVSGFWLKWDFDDPRASTGNVMAMEGVSGPGDSGGPAFILVNGRASLAGISSAQSTRATNGREGVYGVREYYVRLSSHGDWIRTITDDERR